MVGLGPAECLRKVLQSDESAVQYSADPSALRLLQQSQHQMQSGITPTACADTAAREPQAVTA